MAERSFPGFGEVRVDPVTATNAIRLYADMMRIVGRASGRLPAIIVGFSSDDAISNGAAEIQALQAIVDILAGTASDDITRLVKELVEIARMRAPSGEMRTLDLDGDFTGRLDMLMPVLRFVIEVQFRDFFTASVGNGIRELMRRA